jgi:DNA polymerase-1
LVEWSKAEWPVPEPTPNYDVVTKKLNWSRPWGLNTHLKRLLADFNPALRDHLYHKVTKKNPLPPPADFAYLPNPSVDLVARWGNVDLYKREQVGEYRLDDTDLSHCDFKTASHYACQDADVTRLLGMELEPRHRLHDLMEISEIDHGQIPMVERMQEQGMPSDPDHFRALSLEMREQEAVLVGVLEAVTGREINPNSTDQVADLLFKEMKLESLKTTRTGKPSTGKKALQHLRKTNPVVEWIMGSREHVKVSGFCESIVEYSELVLVDEDGTMVRAFPDLEQVLATHPGLTCEWRAFYQLMITRAKTGRLASKKFNALAIPVRTKLGKRIRKGFKVRPGHLLGTWDLNQIEMRVMAHRSQDPVMLEVYNRSPKRFAKWQRDLHIETASKIWGCKLQDVTPEWRTAAKSTGFGIIMGITGVGLSDQMRLYGLDPVDWPQDRCDELIRDWLKVYRVVNDYQQYKRAEARRNGEVRDMFGRRHRLPHATCPLSWIRGEAERQSHALDIQGSAQAIEKMCMARIWREALPGLRAMGHCEPVLQVHDELLFEFDEDLAEVIDPLMLHYLTTTATLSVPIEAGGAMGASWGDLEK